MYYNCGKETTEHKQHEILVRVPADRKTAGWGYKSYRSTKLTTATCDGRAAI